MRISSAWSEHYNSIFGLLHLAKVECFFFLKIYLPLQIPVANADRGVWNVICNFLLRRRNCMHHVHYAHIVIAYCNIEFKLSKKPEMVLCLGFVKKRRPEFAIFKIIFLRNRSVSNAWWFCAKKRKIGKGNMKLIKIWLGRNENCCAEDNHNYMSNMCAK